MKKLLLSIFIIIKLCIFCTVSFGQTIDPSVKPCTCAAVNRVVFSPVLGEIDTASYVGFFNSTDTPSDSICNVDYVVKANGNNQNVLFGTYTLSKKEYSNWATDVDLIIFIRDYISRVKKLELTFK